MNDASSDTGTLVESALGGAQEAFDRLFGKYRERLRKMVRLRMDGRLRAHVDSSGLLAEAQKAAFSRMGEYQADRTLPVFLWLRKVTGETLKAMHEQYVGQQADSAGQEVTLYRGALPEAASISLAAQLLGKMDNIADAAVRAENKIKVQEVLNSLDPLDREVLTLRHFERLSNEEAAMVIGIKKSDASNRYLSALTRLHELLSAIPGLKGRL